MSTCGRCGAMFACAMADGGDGPCWCFELPAAVPVPVAGQAAACWCPACLKQHIASLADAASDAGDAPMSTHRMDHVE